MGGEFVPGVRLAGEFYAEAVRPLLEAEFPRLAYAAALIGPGSEVLGFDTERSTDHDWGPRLLVFLDDEDAERLGGAVDAMLGRRLPTAFGGYPVAFGVTRDPDRGAGGQRLARAGAAAGPRLPGRRRGAQPARPHRTPRPGHSPLLQPALPGPRRRALRRRPVRRDHRPGGRGAAAGRRRGPGHRQHPRAGRPALPAGRYVGI